jgi:hypothetical protein
VRGGVALWGRIELHRRGMRAEFAQIVTLALPSARRHADEVAAVARLLDVEIVSAHDLGAAALAHGDPLERALIPGRSRRRSRSRVPVAAAHLTGSDPWA